MTAERRAKASRVCPSRSPPLLAMNSTSKVSSISRASPNARPVSHGCVQSGATTVLYSRYRLNEDGAGGDQSVVFIDEVYIGRSAGSDFDLFDLERVEVLRGPQGTLFGKNVIGGAVSLVTKKPTEETEMKFEGTVGNLDEIAVRGLVSGQIADNVFGKVSFSSRRRDGYVDSRIDEFPAFFPDTSVDDQHDIDTDSIRAALRFTPTDLLEVNLTANYSTMDRAGPTYLTIGPGGIPSCRIVRWRPTTAETFTKTLLKTLGFPRQTFGA